MSITKKVHKISLIVDANTNQLRSVNEQFKDLQREIARVTSKVDTMGTHFKVAQARINKSLNSTANASSKAHTSMANDVVRHIRRLESLLVGFYALKKAYDVTIGMGHEFNKMMESERIGMSLIISQRLKHVNVLGENVSAMDRWIYANQKAKEVMEDVKEINVSTPHTLEQTTQIYKTMAGQILAYGGSLEQVKQATRDVSVVSKAMNVDFGQLLKTVDALYSGKMKDSDLKRALQNSVGMDFDKVKNLAKTNKEEAVKYVNEMLAKAKIASKAIEKSWSGVTSNFINAWTDIQAELQKPLFDAMKEEIQSAGEYLAEHKEEILDFFSEVKATVKEATPVVVKLAQAFGLLKASLLLNTAVGKLGTLGTKANMARLGVVGLVGAFVSSQKEVTSFGTAISKIGQYFEVGFETINFMVSATVESIVGLWNSGTQRLGAYWDLFVGHFTKSVGKFNVPVAKMINRGLIEPFNIGVHKVKVLWNDFLKLFGAGSDKPILLEEGNLININALQDNVKEGEKLIKDARERLAKPVEGSNLENKLASYRAEANLKLLDALDKVNGKAKETAKSVSTVKDEANKLTDIDFSSGVVETDEDAIKAQNKALKEKNKLYREFLKLSGDREGLFQLDVSEMMDKLLKDGSYTMEQLSDLYDGMWDKYLKDGKKANKGIAMDFTNQFKGLLEGIFDGDFGGALKGFFDGMGTEMLSKPIKAMSESMSETLTGKDGVGGLLGGLGAMGGIVGGLAMSGIGMLVESFFGDKEETPPELGEIRDTSESMANALDYLKDAQYPMLTLTRQMTGYLKTISLSFGGMENALMRSGIDIGGSLFQDTYKKGTLFGGKSTSLYGTSIDIESATMAELMNGELEAWLDTVTKHVSTKWYGAKKTSYNHSYTDLSEDIGTFISNGTTAIFESLTLAGEALGISTTIEETTTTFIEDAQQSISNGIFNGFKGFGSFGSALFGRLSLFGSKMATQTGEWVTETVTKSLADEVIDLGKFDTSGMTSEEVSTEIQNRFSAQVDAITEKYFGAVSEFQKAGEGLGETLFRVIANFDQVSHSMELIGKSVDWRTANIITDVAGGLDSLNASMSSYTENFFTDVEKYDMKLNTMTKNFSSLGLSLPGTNAEFRSLVDGIDTTTDAGATLFAEVISLADGFAEMTNSASSLGTSIKDMVSSIADAWMGNLSYLTIAQKAEYASGYFEIARQSNGEIDTVESARAMAETALRATSTKEEYIPIFNEYIKTLEEQAPQATTDDVVAELRALRAEVQILEETTRRTA